MPEPGSYESIKPFIPMYDGKPCIDFNTIWNHWWNHMRDAEEVKKVTDLLELLDNDQG